MSSLTLWPYTVASPPVTDVRPVSMLKVVDLPAPLWPSRQKRLLWGMDTVTSSTATTDLKVLRRCRSTTARSSRRPASTASRSRRTSGSSAAASKEVAPSVRSTAGGESRDAAASAPLAASGGTTGSSTLAVRQ